MAITYNLASIVGNKMTSYLNWLFVRLCLLICYAVMAIINHYKFLTDCNCTEFN